MQMLGEQLSQKALEFKQDDKFFTRIMSKDTSMANSSCRVYYGDAPSAVPFLWESRPGTPKHTFSDTQLPPLTPPPSYYSSSTSKSMDKSTKSNLFTTILSRSRKKTRVSRPSSMSSTTTSTSSSLSSSSSSSWSSSFQPSSSTLKISKSQRRLCFSCSRSSIHDNDDDDKDQHALGSHTSKLRYEDGNYNNNKGCSLMNNMKNVFTAMVGY